MDILKNLKNLALAALAAIVVYQAEFKPLDIPDGQVLVEESFMDSLANIKPDTTTVIDSVYFGYPVLVTDTVTLSPIDSTTKYKIYSYELDNEDLYYSFLGRLHLDSDDLDHLYTYRLKVPKQVNTTSYITKPVYIPTEIQSSKYGPKNRLYGYISLGGNQTTFIPSVGLDLVTKKDNSYGLQYSRLGNENIYQFKIGTKLW